MQQVELPTEDAPALMIQGDALDVMRRMPDACVDLIATDPPYFEIKDEAWDNQWPDADAYLAWVGELCDEWRRVLKPNGSLYVFASAQMAAGVERVVAERFTVLNRICWAKPAYSTKAEMNSKDGQRSYFPRSEYLVFAEQSCAAAGAEEQRRRANRAAFGGLIQAAMTAAGVTGRDICEALGLYGKVNHGGVVSNWLSGHNEPTEEQWAALVSYFAAFGCAGLLPSSKPALDSNPTAADARRRYEELRRPFVVSERVPYTDVWEYRTVNVYPGKHPCEKPLEMLEHIILASSRPGALVFDGFAGSGTTGVAAVKHDRLFLGIEQDPHWGRVARRRVDDMRGVGGLFDPRAMAVAEAAAAVR